MSIFEQSLSAFHKLCNSTFYLIVVNKFIQVILVSVGGIMVSIAAFQAVDPGSIPGRRMFCQNHHFHIRGLRKKYFVHAVTRIRTWVTAATTQGPNH